MAFGKHRRSLRAGARLPDVKFFNGQRDQMERGKSLLQKTGLIEALERQLRGLTPTRTRRTLWADS